MDDPKASFKTNDRITLKYIDTAPFADIGEQEKPILILVQFRLDLPSNDSP